MRIIEEKDINDFIKRLEQRRVDVDLTQTVIEIIASVRSRGDQALYDFTKQFDQVALNSLEVSEAEIKTGMNDITDELLGSLEKAAESIKAFHTIQLRKSQYLKVPGGTVGEIIKPLRRVGIYVPGGKAAYPSTVLMNAIPAKLAGVEEVIMVTPPQLDGTIKPSVIAAAKLAGVDKIYKLGGAQAVAALAYGTESIKPVSKIVGPGNAYVATAKSLVSGKVGIDMIAGPSEILILADESTRTDYIVTDLISQAEHDERAAAMVIVNTRKKAIEIQAAMKLKLETIERQSIVEKSILNEGAIIIVDSYEKMTETANKIAPEHLEIMTENSEYLVGNIENAGAVFVGCYSPEALGDYYAGPNHTLPTSGTALFSSPLGIDDFIKKMSYINYSREGLKAVSQDIINIATDEGLYGHANAIKVRFGEDDEY